MKKHKPQHRQYTIKHVPGQNLNLYGRIILARDWNAAIEADSDSLTIRSFAKAHGLAPQTWQRELNRGAEGKIVRHLKKSNRWVYPRYDPFRAQESVDKGNANKGAPRKTLTLRRARNHQSRKSRQTAPLSANSLLPHRVWRHWRSVRPDAKPPQPPQEKNPSWSTPPKPSPAATRFPSAPPRRTTAPKYAISRWTPSSPAFEEREACTSFATVKAVSTSLRSSITSTKSQSPKHSGA